MVRTERASQERKGSRGGHLPNCAQPSPSATSRSYSFLTAFIDAGAKEHRVRLVGATPQYVTEDLDGGSVSMLVRRPGWPPFLVGTA
jgi:hypothetical protein